MIITCTKTYFPSTSPELVYLIASKDTAEYF